jgi:zinc transport system substrate-binding protein
MSYAIRFVPLALSGLVAAPALAASDPPQVVTDLPAVHSLVRMVQGDRGDAVLLLDAGASPHDFQLRPSQARAIAEADVILWTDASIAPWLDRAIDASDGAANAIALLDAPETILQPFAFGAPAEEDGHDDHAGSDTVEDDHGDDEDHGEDTDGDAHAEDAAAEGDAHDDHGTIDPHAWLDPDNARAWLPLIAEALAAADPDGAGLYRANAAAADGLIASLDAEIAARFTDTRDRPFAVFHDAYGYFAGHYELTMVAALSLGDAADPGAGRLAALRADLGGQTDLCLFPEAQFDPKVAEQLAGDTGLKLGAPLDPEGSSLPPGPELYGSLMRGLADGIAGCLDPGA